MNMTAGRPATAADVAARAGVSRATVSHILNGRAANFAVETRDRVMDAARELDYRPSPAGRSLVRGRGDTIVALVPSMTIGQNQQDALDRLTEDTKGFSGNVVLRFAGADPDETVTSILALRPLAVVDLVGSLPGPSRDRLAQHGVPTVPRANLQLRESIGGLQVAELTRAGPRRILYASLRDRRPDPLSAQRFGEIELACAQAGLDDPIRVDVPVERDGAFRALAPLLEEGLVGVAAYNDTVAAAAAYVAIRLGRAIPDEVSVIGVDNTPAAQFMSPQLTTIDVNMDTLIDRAVDDLVEELEIPRVVLPATSDDVLFTLIRGQSS